MAGGTELGTVATLFANARAEDGAALLQQVVKHLPAPRVSEIHATLSARASRAPLDIARELSRHYPQNPIVSYIPSVSWANRLARTRRDGAMHGTALAIVANSLLLGAACARPVATTPGRGTRHARGGGDHPRVLRATPRAGPLWLCQHPQRMRMDRL